MREITVFTSMNIVTLFQIYIMYIMFWIYDWIVFINACQVYIKRFKCYRHFRVIFCHHWTQCSSSCFDCLVQTGWYSLLHNIGVGTVKKWPQNPYATVLFVYTLVKYFFQFFPLYIESVQNIIFGFIISFYIIIIKYSQVPTLLLSFC